jgi:hypothetical protein
LNTARFGLAGCGTQTSALAFGGDLPPTTGATEQYDGTSWTSTTSMSTARYLLAGAGTQPAALTFGGDTGTAVLAATEEFTITGTKGIKTITVS